MASSASEPPLVGVTSYLEPTIAGAWDRRAALLPEVYLHAVTDAGGAAVVLPPQPVDDALARRVLAGLDALVLSGGADVDPARYGHEAHPRTDVPRADRDAWELALVRAALEVGTPLLAVCRGLQVLDVALRGTLHQHLPEVVGHDRHAPSPGVFGTTVVHLVEGSLVARVLQPPMGQGRAPITVHCHHHQALDALGEGLVVSARADDGTVEAVELPPSDRAPFVVGVQWHTEEDRHDRRLFAALVDAARRRGAAARPQRERVSP